MSRVKTFNSTGLATAGRLYAGDLNAIQDQYADLDNLTQNVRVATLAIGEAGLQLIRYGAGEARISGALRADGVLRGLGGVVPGAFTTTQRDAISLGSRPYGIGILNTTTNQWEWNSGTDAAPNWKPMGFDASGALTLTGAGSVILFTSQTASNYILAAKRAADANYRFRVREDGMMEWGPGNTGVDVALYRQGVDALATDDDFVIAPNADHGFYFLTAGGTYGGMKRTAADGVVHMLAQTDLWFEPTSKITQAIGTLRAKGNAAAGTTPYIQVNNTVAAKTFGILVDDAGTARVEFTGLLGNIITIDSTGRVLIQSRPIVRHPFGTDHRIDGGTVANTASSYSVSFNAAFTGSGIKSVVASNITNGSATIGSVTSSGFTVNNPGVTGIALHWLAFGEG